MERCKICGKKYRNRGEVRSHIRLKHLEAMDDAGRYKYEELRKKWKRGEIKLSDLHEEVRE